MKLICIFLLFCCSIVSGCSHYKPITGTVLDAETMKPIEGAVVMVEWTGHEGMPGLAHTVSLKVVEAITDKNGIAHIEGISKVSVEAPTLAIYKPGYVTWSSRAIFPSHQMIKDFIWGDQTFKLEQFKPEYSYIKHEAFFSSSINSTIGVNSKKLIRETFRDWEKAKFIEEADKIDEMRKRREAGDKQ